MRLGVLITLLAFATPSFAEPIAISIPQEKLTVHFDARPLKKIAENYKDGRYSYVGNAGTFNLSLFVEPSKCPGDESNDVRYKCFLEILRTVPLVQMSTVRGHERPAGVVVFYMMLVGSSQVLHANLLFRHGGKAGDLHASVAAPKPDDVKFLFALMESVQLRKSGE